ncbi:hypothetical protein EBI_21714 [Enterocytozoon bieneusi H348]|nr:hypothetical protein EBI_21714 [Enterocytozoon bieneusi H348]|eukprot:XP_002649545.1 hypothetical protein EBI_21714 [Enterocytozoon bieneusi H348]
MLFYLSLLTGIAGKFHRSVNIQADDKIIKFVNFLREDSGIDTLDTHPALLKVAKEQVRYMCENNKLTHASRNLESLKQRFRKEGFEAILTGENIAKKNIGDSNYDHDYTEVVKVWYKSKAHRKNILGDFTFTAAAVCITNNTKYWIQVFAKGNEFEDIENEFMKIKDSSENTSPIYEPEKTIKKLKRKQSSPNPFNYGIIDPSRSPCTNLKECKVGQMVRPTFFSEVDNGVNNNIKLTSTHSIPQTTDIKRIVKKVLIDELDKIGSIAKNYTQSLSSSSFLSINTTTIPESNKSVPTSSTSASTSVSQPPRTTSHSNAKNTSDLLSIIPTLIKELKNDLYKDIAMEKINEKSVNDKTNSNKKVDEDIFKNLIKEAIEETRDHNDIILG